MSLSWIPTSRRQRPSAITASGGPRTLTIVVCLLWMATPTFAVYFVNVSKYTEEQSQTSAISRCAPLSHDVLWTRLKLAVPRLTVPGSNDDDDDDDDDDDADGSQTQLSLVSNEELSPSGAQSFLSSDTSQTLATSSNNLHHRRHSRRRRRKQRWRRRERRKRRRRLGVDGRRRSESTSWSCRLQKSWKRMQQDVFPAYIQTGSCRKQQTCMLGMYSCRPRRYIIKVLRRISAADDDSESDDGCRPVPVVGPDAVYEEAWSLVDTSVTVACECSRRRRSGTYHRRPTTDNI